MSGPSFVRALRGALLAACLVMGPLVGLGTAQAQAQAQTGTPYPARPEVQSLIEELVTQHGFDRARLGRWFAAARYSPTVERLMQPPIPFGQRNWYDYRDRYLDAARVQAGLAFWRANSAALARAQDEYGVPPQYVVAIIGVETFYGRITGNFRTLDALMTLSFDYPRRADFYRAELTQFLLLAREQGANPLAYKGSYAGAIGLPQFMPGSIRRWAVDFDGNGRIDLADSPADAIGSVASFLAAHGWQRDWPVLAEASASEEIVDALGRGIVAQTPWSSALYAGLESEISLPLDAPVLVIDLPVIDAGGQPAREYRVGTASFSALLHYNRSYFYATAVTELAAEIALRKNTDASSSPEPNKRSPP